MVIAMPERGFPLALPGNTWELSLACPEGYYLRASLRFAPCGPRFLEFAPPLRFIAAPISAFGLVRNALNKSRPPDRSHAVDPLQIWCQLRDAIRTLVDE